MPSSHDYICFYHCRTGKRKKKSEDDDEEDDFDQYLESVQAAADEQTVASTAASSTTSTGPCPSDVAEGAGDSNGSADLGYEEMKRRPKVKANTPKKPKPNK